MALPFGMQVQIDFVDQDYCLCLRRGVAQFRVGLKEAARKLQNKGQKAAFAVGQLAYRKCGRTAVDHQASAPIAGDAQVFVPGEEPRYRFLEGANGATAGGAFRFESFSRAQPRTELAEPKLPLGERIRKGRRNASRRRSFRGSTLNWHCSPG